jgi:hypothetical protein
VGTEGTVAAEWAIPFGTLTFSNFLFASGDFLNFVYTSKDIFAVKSYIYKYYEVLQTSNSQTKISI